MAQYSIERDHEQARIERDRPEQADLPLGVLDFLTFRNDGPVRAKREMAVNSAILADHLGYRRFWVPEHHATGVPSTNPLAWLPVLGSLTRTIRVGSAVSLIRLRDPYLVAEDLATAAHFLRDRLDVGFGRGDVSGEGTHVLDPIRKDGEATDAAMQTAADVLAHGTAWIDPADGTFQRWLHGAGYRSAELAAAWGFDYCHALFFNPDFDACLTPLGAHRDAHPAGRRAVAVALTCNEDAQRARSDGMLRGISVNCVGTAEQGAAMILHLLAHELIDEVIIIEQSSAPEDHYAALSDLADLVRREQPVVGRPSSSNDEVSRLRLGEPAVIGAGV